MSTARAKTITEKIKPLNTSPNSSSTKLRKKGQRSAGYTVGIPKPTASRFRAVSMARAKKTSILRSASSNDQVFNYFEEETYSRLGC
ncbi:MAG: hypothetical protein OEZ48_04700 [Candidatus Bathyarchaeota archaeon]|nr:hypothetical protein [Candidatus Bathyarchaeota archaeon]